MAVPPSGRGDKTGKFLLGWELGGGFGHVARLAAIAEWLLARGAEILIAARPGARGRDAFRRLGDHGSRLAFTPSPCVDPDGADTLGSARPETLADMLIRFGYDRPDRIFLAADRWNAILREWRPDVVVSDSAPSLNLTTLGRAPLVCFGPPFLVPPRGRPSPPLRLDADRVSDEARERERRILAAMNMIRKANGQPPYRASADVWHGDSTFVAAPPLLDPFGEDLSRAHVEPFNLDPIGAERPRAVDLYLYLPRRPSVCLGLLEAARDQGLSCAAFLGGEDQNMLVGAASARLRNPAPLMEQLPLCRLFVHEGGLASTWAGLKLGVRQLIIPCDAEKWNTAVLARRASDRVLIATAGDLTPESIGAIISSVSDFGKEATTSFIDAGATISLDAVMDVLLGFVSSR